MSKYPSMTKELKGFSLTVEGGSYDKGDIVVMLGENGCGKSTLMKMLCGQKDMEPDTAEFDVV